MINQFVTDSHTGFTVKAAQTCILSAHRRAKGNQGLRESLNDLIKDMDRWATSYVRPEAFAKTLDANFPGEVVENIVGAMDELFGVRVSGFDVSTDDRPVAEIVEDEVPAVVQRTVVDDVWEACFGDAPAPTPANLNGGAKLVALSLWLEEVNPDALIHTIKVVRQHTGYGLREAKSVVDAVKGGVPTLLMSAASVIGSPTQPMKKFSLDLENLGCRTAYRTKGE